MFVIVQFGERQSEIFNSNCRIINFINFLKERCNVDPEDHVDLVDMTGELVNLSEHEQSFEPATTLLKERRSYILVRVARSEGTEGSKYEPLLSDLGKSHPTLAELLKSLSNSQKDRDRKSCTSRRSWASREGPSTHTARSKPAASPKRAAGAPSRS